MSIGQNVKVYREYNGMSIGDFASHVGLTVEERGGVDAGGRLLPWAEIRRICRVLTVAREALLSRQPTMPAPQDDAEGSILMPVDELQSLLGKMRE